MTAIQLIDDPEDRYQPGACNIGPAEIERRRRSGIAGLVVAALVAIALVVTDAPAVLRLAVWVPLFVGLLGFVQARMRFCVGYAAAGIKNFGPLGTQEKVADSAAHREDLRRAAGVTIATGAVAAIITIAFMVLPV
ncbi:MAG: hypothetical protein U0869_19150 [Chloroflexota bacterium]